MAREHIVFFQAGFCGSPVLGDGDRQQAVSLAQADRRHLAVVLDLLELRIQPPCGLGFAVASPPTAAGDCRNFKRARLRRRFGDGLQVGLLHAELVHVKILEADHQSW
jgi:hypothetical protein